MLLFKVHCQSQLSQSVTKCFEPLLIQTYHTPDAGRDAAYIADQHFREKGVKGNLLFDVYEYELPGKDSSSVSGIVEQYKHGERFLSKVGRNGKSVLEMTPTGR